MDTAAELQYWQKKNFGRKELSFSRAVNSLGTNKPLIEVRKVGGRWLVYDIKKQAPAVFQHAGVISSMTNPDTGNYVPPGNAVPTGLYENQIEKTPGWKCKARVAFNTTIDKSFFDCQRIIEEHVCGLPGFNTTGRNRRPWGNGDFSDSFIVNWSIFKPSTPSGSMKKLWYDLHPWVQEAVKTPGLLANPERPRMFRWEKDELKPIRECIPDEFMRGDLVWVSFMLAYIVGGAEWYPDMRPIDFVRVGHADKEHAPSFALDQIPANHLTSGKAILLSDTESDDEGDSVTEKQPLDFGSNRKPLPSGGVLSRSDPVESRVSDDTIPTDGGSPPWDMSAFEASTSAEPTDDIVPDSVNESAGIAISIHLPEGPSDWMDVDTADGEMKVRKLSKTDSEEEPAVSKRLRNGKGRG